MRNELQNVRAFRLYDAPKLDPIFVVMQDLWAKSFIRPKYPNNLEVRVFVLALGKGEQP